MKNFILLLVLCVGASATADERFLPKATLLKMGYKPFVSAAQSAKLGLSRTAPALQRNLQWPVEFEDAAHSIAQNYVNFQQYGGTQAYFHGGCDLRANADSWVTAPVTGTLEAGYYSYAENEDGSSQKYWKPWTGQTHDDPYFELAIVTADGYRIELHHVNSTNLPASTIAALNKGGVVIQAGTKVGHVYYWPDGEYHHVHYNIHKPDGTIVNPEAYSIEVPDHVAPTIVNVYAKTSDGRSQVLRESETAQGNVDEIVVATTETRDNSVYVQTPPYAAIKFANGHSFAWDFREQLLGPDGHWPDLRKVFLDSINGSETFGQYGKGMFLMRLPTANQKGAFTIEVGDTAGNMTKFSGAIN